MRINNFSSWQNLMGVLQYGGPSGPEKVVGDPDPLNLAKIDAIYVAHSY